MNSQTVLINPSTHSPYTPPPMGVPNFLIPEIDAASPDDESSRVLDTMQHALGDLQATLSESDFPSAKLYPHSKNYLENLRRLSISDKPSPGFYDIDPIEGYIEIGTIMMDALKHLDNESLILFTQEFLLHETLHIDQGLYSTNFVGIHYASVVLEEIDYFADAFAMATLIAWQLRCNPKQNIKEIVESVSSIAIKGLEVFDKIDYLDFMQKIDEPRLRRYLIWLTQRERLLACRNMEQVLATLYPRISVELSLLQGSIDSKYGLKKIDACSENAEYFLSLNGKLVRQGKTQQFDIQKLFESIRTYNSKKALEQIRFVVMEHHTLLLPQL